MPSSKKIRGGVLKPRWMRRQVSCPDCGKILPHDKAKHPRNASDDGLLPYKAFDCVGCGAHYTPQDFWREQDEKWNRMADLQNE